MSELTSSEPPSETPSEPPSPTGPFVSDLFPFPSHLLSTQNYSTSTSHFVAQLNLLSETYSSIRIVKGDGSCFYRSFLYGLITILAEPENESERLRIIEYVQKSIITLEEQGYDPLIMEGFQEVRECV